MHDAALRRGPPLCNSSLPNSLLGVRSSDENGMGCGTHHREVDLLALKFFLNASYAGTPLHSLPRVQTLKLNSQTLALVNVQSGGNQNIWHLWLDISGLRMQNILGAKLCIAVV